LKKKLSFFLGSPKITSEIAAATAANCNHNFQKVLMVRERGGNHLLLHQQWLPSGGKA